MDFIIVTGLSGAGKSRAMNALEDIEFYCVDNIPLIASSIMSKKIASGANKIVLEVTYGKGAFMKTLEDAKLLASKMEELGRFAKLEVKSVFTPISFIFLSNISFIIKSLSLSFINAYTSPVVISE